MEIVLHPRSPTLAWIRSLGKPSFWEVCVFVDIYITSFLLKLAFRVAYKSKPQPLARLSKMSLMMSDCEKWFRKLQQHKEQGKKGCFPSPSCECAFKWS